MTKVIDERRPRLRLWRTWPVDASVLSTTAIAYAIAPQPEDSQAAAALASFFSSIAQSSMTLLVAVALFQGALGSPVEHRVRRWISSMSFVYLGLAGVAALAGTIGTLPAVAYPFLFALSVGPGVGGLLTVLLMGRENVTQQRKRAAAARAIELDPDRPQDPHRAPSDRPHRSPHHS